MDLNKNGKLILSLRKAKGMTQKQVADKLNICAKTVSKWETGHGFPDISTVSALAEILGVSADTILSGNLNQNMEEVGNMKKIKFYVCPHCQNIIQGTGEGKVFCCGKQLEPLNASKSDEEHTVSVSELENDYYITFNHEMTKEHFISFVSYVTFDRVLTIRLYPEQDSAVRFQRMYGGKLYYYCNKHGLFEYEIKRKRKTISNPKSMTSIMSAFARAYHSENSENPVFKDSIARKLFSDEEYKGIQKYILNGADFLDCKYEEDAVKTAVNKQFAPITLAREVFCRDSLETAVKTGFEQYVILAGGLETSAFENKYNSLKIFEIDKDSAVSDKKYRLGRANIEIPDNVKLISCNLTREDMGAILKKNGFDTGKKTFFSCLGLFYYLSENEILRIFKSISDFAAEGSTIVFDFADKHLFSSEVKRVKNMIDMAAKGGESMKSCFSFGELERMLEKYNFLIYEFLNDKDMQNRYFSNRTDGLTAFENINYALAVLKHNNR